MFIPCQEDVFYSISPVISSSDTEETPIPYRHDSSASIDTTEIEALEKELDSLKRTEAVVTQQYAESLEKTIQQKKSEKINYESDRSKQLRQPTNDLEAETQHLREEMDVEAGELQLKLLLAKHFAKQRQRKQAAAQSDKFRISPNVADDFVGSSCTQKGTFGNGKANNVLSHVCEGLSDGTLQQIDDKEQRGSVVQRKLELIHLVQEYMSELEELEIGGHSRIPVDCNPTTPPKLGFSPIITGACITPVEAEDAHSEIEDLIQRLSTVEVKNERLLSDYTKLSNSHRELLVDFDSEVEYINTLQETNLRLTTQIDNLISQLEAQAQLLHTKDQQTEQQVAQTRAELTAEYQARLDALEMQRQRAYSIFSDPDFVASLQRSRASTFSLSRPPTPTAPFSNSHRSQFANNVALNVNLSITLRPSDTRLWSLLRHVKRSLFWTSLNIEGPQDLVREFLASMEEANREFEEQGQRVARLERAVAERGEVVEWLREWWRR